MRFKESDIHTYLYVMRARFIHK